MLLNKKKNKFLIFLIFQNSKLNVINYIKFKNKTKIVSFLKLNNSIFFKNLIIFWCISNINLFTIFSKFRFKIIYYFNIKSNIFNHMRTINIQLKLKLLKYRIRQKRLHINFNENNYFQLRFLKHLRFIKTLFSLQRNFFIRNFRKRDKKYFRYRYTLISLAFFMKSRRCLLLNFRKSNILNNNIFKFILSIFVKKNNIFVLFKINNNIIYQFSSGILKLKGKKKRAPLTATNLTKYLLYHSSRFFYYNRRTLARFSNKVYLDVHLYSFLSNPVVKSFMYIIRENKYAISHLIDKVRYPHSLGVKKKKLRRI
jgi:hypothetical protein